MAVSLVHCESNLAHLGSDMTTTVASIITEVKTILQDDGTRWPTTELLSYLNDGQREIATIRPDLFVVTQAIPLVTGVKQTIPDACINLIEFTRNTDGAAIRQTDRTMLDLTEPGWYSKTPSKTIKHFCYDPREPDAFYVYPPAAVGASVDAVMSKMPDDAVVNINCKDTCKNPLIHFTLFRAYQKDAEFGGNAALSAAHYQLFKDTLSQDAAAGQALTPTPTN